MAWDAYITAEDREVMELAGFGRPVELGSRLAVLVIDMTYNFCGGEPMDIRDAIKRWPNACGHAGWDAVDRVSDLLGAARGHDVPIIYTKGYSAVGPPTLLGRWGDKNARMANQEPEGNSIVAPIAPQASEIVIEKRKPSGFHGTDLTNILIQTGVDSLVVCGATTSGCVRATVVDAFSLNFRVAVVGDAAADRIQTAHWVSLYDMHMKYANVVDTAEAISTIERTSRAGERAAVIQ